MSVIAYHLIWTNYGTWLANDPRGSGSREVYTPNLAELGEVHYGRRRIQPARQVVQAFYAEAEPRLQFPVIRFDREQFADIAAAFAETISNRPYTCYACAIMPDHVHMAIRKHRDSAEQMIEKLQNESREYLQKNGVVPAVHPVWTLKGWHVFLDLPADVRSCIRYVEGNPMKEGLTRQEWPFVTVYDNWPFHKQLNRKRK
jgi:REP element-mobilizing transposase RayT